MDYGNETIIGLASGGSIRCESAEDNPNGTTYVRVCDNVGNEVAYWTADEWRDEPEFVLGAIMGAARNPIREVDRVRPRG